MAFELHVPVIRAVLSQAAIVIVAELREQLRRHIVVMGRVPAGIAGQQHIGRSRLPMVIDLLQKRLNPVRPWPGVERRIDKAHFSHLHPKAQTVAQLAERVECVREVAVSNDKVVTTVIHQRIRGYNQVVGVRGQRNQ